MAFGAACAFSSDSGRSDRIHPLLKKCEACDGTGKLLAWVEVHQFVQMLTTIVVEEQAQ
jgi:hypothetical protein